MRNNINHAIRSARPQVPEEKPKLSRATERQLRAIDEMVIELVAISKDMRERGYGCVDLKRSLPYVAKMLTDIASWS